MLALNVNDIDDVILSVLEVEFSVVNDCEGEELDDRVDDF